MQLQTQVSASEFDDHYQMAFVYCYDSKQDYCFSLSRFPESEEIEIMVLDQVSCRVNDLSVTLLPDRLWVQLEPAVAALLDGHRVYEVCFKPTEVELGELHDALGQIFKNKSGYSS